MEKKIEDMSFEEAFAKLNKILEEFESGDVSLETSINLYEKGMLLKNHCDKKPERNDPCRPLQNFGPFSLPTQRFE